MTTPLELVLSKLPDAKKSGDEYKAKCPAHDDKKASLTVRAAADGKVLLHCHAHCDAHNVVARLGLAWSDMFSANGHSGNGHKKPALIATYDYKDASGKLLYQSLRYEPKDFRQRQPDGHGGWIWSTTRPPVTLVPYRLPELLAADAGLWVFIAEGEKDVNNLYAVGLIATTNVGGAGKWRTEYAHHLQGRRVCILPDNDDAGRKHGHDVAHSLAGVAADVRWLMLPGLPDKGDVSDWLEFGGTAAALVTMADNAPSPGATPAPASAERPKLKSVDLLRILANAGYTFRLNMCDDSLEVNGERICDPIRSTMRTYLRDSGYDRYLAAAEDAWMAEAYRHRYHPVHQYLNSLKWDGGQWIASLSDCFDDEPHRDADGNEHHLFPIYLRRWLIGAVARAYTGRQNAVFTIDGAQGIGKSRWVRWLCPLPGMFVDRGINPDNKDDTLAAITRWIWEVSELGATTRRADVESLKGFLSREAFTVRPPYGHYDIEKPGLANFVGTVNNSAGIFSDPTGSRRFWAVTVRAIDWTYTDLDIHQVWAEAVAAYHAGEPWTLTPEEAKWATTHNESFEVDDPVELLLKKYFTLEPGDRQTWTPTVEILQTLQEKGLQGSTRANSMALASTLKRLGMVRHIKDGKRGYLGIS